MGADIRRVPGPAATHDSSGYTFYNAFEITGVTSIVKALEALDNAGHYRGSVYTDHQGNSPSNFITCVSRNVTPKIECPVGGSSGFYVALLTYRIPTSRKPLEPQPDGSPRYRWESTLSSETRDIAPSGQLLQNTVQEPLLPPATVHVVQRTLVVDWIMYGANELSLGTSLAPYENKTNGNLWHGIPIECAKSRCFEIRQARIPVAPGQMTLPFWVTGKFDVRPQLTLDNGQTYPGWQDVRGNKGFRELLGEDSEHKPKYRKITAPDKNGVEVPVADPVWLTEDGHILPVNWPKHYLPFRFYSTANFAALNI